MAISTYQQLQDAVAAWLERSDLTARIPDFIALAERRIFRVLRTPANERTVFKDRLAAEGDEWLLPEHFLQLKRLIINGQTLTRITDSEFYGLTAETGQPKYFYRYANRLKVWPAPAEDYRWVLNYWTDMELSDDYPSNTVLQVAPDAYLFGALLAAEVYLMNDARIPIWEAQFQDALEQVQDMADQADIAGSPSISKGAY